jgi:hypothetical protein
VMLKMYASQQDLAESGDAQAREWVRLVGAVGSQLRIKVG